MQGKTGDSHIVRLCPYCGQERQFNAKGNVSLELPQGCQTLAHGTPVRFDVYAYQCVMCGGLLMAEIKRSGSYTLGGSERTYPSWIPKRMEGLPDAVASCLHEAQMCFSVGAWNATAVLVRRAVEECCREKGAKKWKLEQKIDELAATNVITSQLRDWAHEVRFIGNDGAHGSKSTKTADPSKQDYDEFEPTVIPLDVTEEDAKAAIAFADELFKYVYVMPARIKQRKDAKLAAAAEPPKQ